MNFLEKCQFYYNDNINDTDEEKQLFQYKNIPSNANNLIKEIDFNNNLPHELINLYRFINNKNICFNFKNFIFNSFYEIENYMDNMLIPIGNIYQGMGYFVNLIYHQEHNIYLFIILGGSDGNEQQYRNNNFCNINIEKMEDYKKIKNLSNVINIIENNSSKYCDDAYFMNSIYVC